MTFNYEYLKDKDFNLIIDKAQSQEMHIKITLLDWNENPLQEIEGYASAGSLSLAGDSAVRRTGSLTMQIPKTENSNVTNVNNIFSINKKIALQIGVTNKTPYYLDYPILWYPQGVFVITGASLTHSTTAVSVSLQIRDKMSLLNGDCGGTINASTQFDSYDTIDENGDWIISQPVFEQIIREAVNHFGGEQLGKIIVSDLEPRAKMIMRWLGSCPLYLVNDNGSYSMTTDYSIIPADAGYTAYYYGDDIGYTMTDFTYPGELILNAGDNVVGLLDKIKNTLGNYEYFYDIYGNFIFQEIKNYLNTTYTTSELANMLNSADYVVDMTSGEAAYDLRNSQQIISYSNSPQFNKIKNDYVIWGIREGVTGSSIPIRYHLVIDQKPAIGNIYEVFFYEDPDDGLMKAKATVDFNTAAEMESNPGAAGVFYRDLSSGDIYSYGAGMYSLLDGIQMEKVQTTDWRSELYLQGVMAEPLGLFSNDYYAELNAEWPKLYELKKDSYTDLNGDTIYTGGFKEEVLASPSSIDYFLDFIDSGAAISQLSVSAIGRRSHVVSNNDINCIFAPEIPDFVIIENGQDTTEELREEAENMGQAYIQVDSAIFKTIGTGGISNDAYTEVKNLLYEYTQYNESVSVTMMPVYTMEPNILISLEDQMSDISGNFLIKNVTMPLTVGTNMTISGTRAVEKF